MWKAVVGGEGAFCKHEAFGESTPPLVFIFIEIWHLTFASLIYFVATLAS
jgi:hypothetical protein